MRQSLVMSASDWCLMHSSSHRHSDSRLTMWSRAVRELLVMRKSFLTSTSDNWLQEWVVKMLSSLCWWLEELSSRKVVRMRNSRLRCTRDNCESASSWEPLGFISRHTLQIVSWKLLHLWKSFLFRSPDIVLIDSSAKNQRRALLGIWKRSVG